MVFVLDLNNTTALATNAELPHRGQSSVINSQAKARLALGSRGGHGPPRSSHSDRTSARKRNNICSEFACGGDSGGGLLREVTKRQCAGACERGNPERIFRELHINRNSGAPCSALFQTPRDPPWKQAQCRSQSCPISILTDKVIAIHSSFCFPGNIYQLKSLSSKSTEVQQPIQSNSLDRSMSRGSPL